MASTWQYSVHPGVRMAQGIIARLKDKTGRSLDEWIALAQKSGPKDEKGRIAWLKSTHGLGTNYAGWITERSFGRGQESSDPDAYLQAVFTAIHEGDVTRAMDRLQLAANQRTDALIFAFAHPALRALRADARIQSIAARVGHPAAANVAR